MLKQLAAVAALRGGTAHGQTPNAFPIDFPEGAQPPSAAQLAEQLGGQVFTAKLSDGVTWRMDYKTSGYLLFNINTDQRDNGTWHTEDGRVWMEFGGWFPTSCIEFRMSGNTLYLRRSSTGEVVALQKQ